MSLNGYSVADAVRRSGFRFRDESIRRAYDGWEIDEVLSDSIATMPRVTVPSFGGEFLVEMGRTPVRAPFPRMWLEFESETEDGERFGMGVFLCDGDREEGYTSASMFRMSRQERVPVLLFEGYFTTAPDATLTGWGAHRESEAFAEQGGPGVVKFMRGVVSVCIQSIALMNCKNVSLVDAPVTVKPPSKKQRRKRTPALTFKTIKLPGGSSSGGDGTGEPGETARHIVRGNFATYTDENPLFGNITGTFWRPAHVRGKTKHGIVQKDYEVSA